MPWGLQVHCMDPSTQTATPCWPTSPSTLMPGLYQPTFLYESIWCVGVAILVVWADRKWTLGYGRAFAVYVAAYTVGRGWIEYLRIDQAHHILGLRLNDWTAIVVFIGAVVYFVRSAKNYPGRETTPYLAEQAALRGTGGSVLGSDSTDVEPIGALGTEPESLEAHSLEAHSPDVEAGDTASAPATDAADTDTPDGSSDDDEPGPAAEKAGASAKRETASGEPRE